MKFQRDLSFLLAAASVLSAVEVTDQRTAEIRGGGGDGKCTIEVEVDDSAEVEIIGTRAQIRTTSGSAAVFRRFQCNQEMPNNPGNFTFRGIDGRGRQTLVRNPGRGPAVIRIEDSSGGRHGYTFDIMWRGANGPWNNSNGNGNGGWNGNNRPNGNGGIWNNGNGNGNNGGIWNNGNNGNNGGIWNNGNNSNWNSEINFSGRGSGTINDNRGNRNQLENCNVSVSRGGDVRVDFVTDQNFTINFTGRVQSVNNGRIIADVNGGRFGGLMDIYIDSRNRVQRVYMNSNSGGNRVEVNWRN
jgi:hypothetical protein